MLGRDGVVIRLLCTGVRIDKLSANRSACTTGQSGRRSIGNRAKRIGTGTRKRSVMPITATMKAPATPAVRQTTTRRGTLFAADRYWAGALATPYIAVFVVFVIYPIGYKGSVRARAKIAVMSNMLADPADRAVMICCAQP
jgi:hypothetical protein